MVFLIDDDINVINNITMRLDLDDIEVKSFLNYKERIEYAKNNNLNDKYQLFICDYFLSKDSYNGVKVIQELSQITELPKTILYTGNKKNISITEKGILNNLNVLLIEKSNEDSLFDIIEDIFDI